MTNYNSHLKKKQFPTFFLESTLALVVFHLLNRPPEIARVWCQAWSYRIFETGFEWKSGWVTIELEWKMIRVKNYENAGLSQHLIEGKCEVGWKLSWSKIWGWTKMILGGNGVELKYEENGSWVNGWKTWRHIRLLQTGRRQGFHRTCNDAIFLLDFAREKIK